MRLGPFFLGLIKEWDCPVFTTMREADEFAARDQCAATKVTDKSN
jgi:hypothetical protein